MNSATHPVSTTRNDELSEELQPGTTLLQGQYTIERFLGAGGFALTYLAYDSLSRPVVIKECFPSSLCIRSNLTVRARSQSRVEELNKIVRLFFREAQRLATLRHTNIVGVHQVFQDNGTAYMALDYIEGPNLLDMIEDGHNPSP
ncbi:serine/threonine protein kinase, partial [Escherichia coli]|nr:serine/threonine protein kinase [Escherichia coli]